MSIIQQIFAYNTGAPISGTTQVGDIAIIENEANYYPGLGGLTWWGGPDESQGYVIAAPVSGNTQPTPLFSGNLILSPTYKGGDINLSNSNQTALQQFGYQQSVLGQTLINNVDKVMFSVQSNVCPGAGNPFFQSIGVGTTSMNYSTQYGAYPGNDTQSVGFSMDGNFYFNGSIVQSALPTWTTTDIIDVAVDLYNDLIWIRVNGGTWAGNPAGANDPATNQGGLSLNGLTFFYPVLSPGNDVGQMTIQNSAIYGLPEGYQLLGVNVTASVKFLGTKNMTNPFNESTFVELTNISFNQSFSNGNDASTWLTSNGYWNSWVSITPTPTATLSVTPTVTPTNTTTSTPTPSVTNTQTPTPSVTTTSTPTLTPTKTLTPTPTSTSGGGGGDGWFFYTPEGPIQAPPTSSGNTIFVLNGNSSFNPNFTGASITIYFNVYTQGGTDYATQFQSLASTGGTFTMTQNGVSATYSGANTTFNYSPNSFLGFNVTNYNQLVSSAATPFISGSPITLTFNGVPVSTPTPTPTNTSTPVTATPTPTNTVTPTVTPSITPTNTETPTPTPTITPTNTITPTITPSSTPAPGQIIVAAGGVNALSYSYDGDNWVNSSNGATFVSQPAPAVASSPTTFVAGGPNGSTARLIYSNNGITWSASTNGNTLFNSVNGIAYGGGKFVAVGINTSALAGIAYSTDGITWTASNSVTGIFGSVPLSVAYNGSRWVATAQPGGGANPKNTIAYSDDGITWTASANSTSIFTSSGRGVAWGGDKWVAVGTGTNRMAYSTDGITWSATTNGNTIITGTGYGVRYNGSQWVAVGQGTNSIAYSNNGLTWSASTNGNTIFSFQGYCITWDSFDSQWIAGGQGTNQLAISTDGITWSATTNGNTIMNDRVLALSTRN
mgnify:CR=1 FL=1